MPHPDVSRTVSRGLRTCSEPFQTKNDEFRNCPDAFGALVGGEIGPSRHSIIKRRHNDAGLNDLDGFAE